MSLPTFPSTENTLTREEVVNQIISSIAMEELGLSHIINAEGEKMQYALGTIPGVSGPDEPLTMEQLLELNKSVIKTLDSTMMNQFFLKEKLVNALTASIMQGPTGPTGPQGPATIAVEPTVTALEPEEAPTVENIGPSDQEVVLQFGIPRGATGAAGASILGSYADFATFIAAHPTGTEGDAYLVGNVLYVWGGDPASWQDMGSLVGPTGAAGASILASYDDARTFLEEHPTGTEGDAYLVEGDLYVWVAEPAPGTWADMGRVVGATGPEGPTGPEGAGLEILGSYNTLAELRAAHPTGEPGQVYAVDGLLYYWDADASDWLLIENLYGPTGPTGPQGETGAQGIQGEQGIPGVAGMQGIPGEQGPSGTGGSIQGVYATEAELIAAHSTGVAEEFYLVGNEADGYSLYIWDTEGNDWVNTGLFVGAVGLQGPTGPQGEIGPQGPAGPLAPGQQLFHLAGETGNETVVLDGTVSFTSDTLDISVESGPTVRVESRTEHAGSLIPFTTGLDSEALHTNAQGAASQIMLSAFGAHSDPISITATGFTFPSGNNFYLPITLSHDIRVREIYATFTNYDGFNPTAGVSVYPFVILATAEQDSNIFTFLPNTKVRSTLPWIGGSTIPPNTNLYGSSDPLDEVIPAGSRLAICCGFDMVNGSATVIGYYFFFSGSIYYE